MTQRSKEWLADMGCLLTAVIWGAGFVATQWALDSRLPASIIMAGRFWIASLILLVCSIPLLKKITQKHLRQGALAGLFLFLGFYIQVEGQSRTSVSHASFLTTLNVILVPFLVWIFTKRRPPAKVFLLAGMTMVGATILAVGGDAGGKASLVGDALTLVCAVFFALHIAYLGQVVRDENPNIINLIQLGTAALLSTAMLPVAGVGDLSGVNWTSGVLAIVYLGAFSTCLCYFLQTTAQKYTAASKASILLSTEGFFGAVFSVALGMEPLTLPLVVGGLIIMLSVALLEAKLPGKREAEVPESGE